MRRHPLILRVLHWLGAAAMITMILSGWAIYNASPLLPFFIPPDLTLGGWLGAGIAWHLTGMWLLFATGLTYLVWGLISGHFRREFLPITAAGLARDLRDAFTFRLQHEGGYNAVQRLLYLLVVLAGVFLVLTGLSIWKPVQLGWLTALFGGYDIARRIHFALMCCVAAFVVIHLTLVALVPRSLRAMLLGGARS